MCVLGGSPSPPSSLLTTAVSKWVVNADRLSQAWLIMRSQTCLKLDSLVDSAKSD